MTPFKASSLASIMAITSCDDSVSVSSAVQTTDNSHPSWIVTAEVIEIAPAESLRRKFTDVPVNG